MSYEDVVATMSTINALKSYGVSKLRQFTFHGHLFSPGDLIGMAAEIENGNISVKYNSKLKGSAEYDSGTNTLYLGFLSINGFITRKALVVHETTHAMYDRQSKSMDIATSESIAYIAQCQYARANSTDPDSRLNSSDSNKDRVFEVGWDIAGKILNGGSVDSTDVSNMRQAISNHPYYVKNASSNAGFDG